jgi:hypothetical protein
LENSACCPGNVIIGGMRPVLQGPGFQASVSDEGRAAPRRPRVSPRICRWQSKEQPKMKWFKKVQEPTLKPALKPAPVEKEPKKTLRIEELEERITPNAIWGD